MAYKLFVNGAVLPASDLNSAFGTGGWTAFTPTVSSGLTVGNGVWSAAYMQIGKTVHIRIRFTFGTTSAVTGAIALGLPVTAGAASYSSGLMLAGGGNYPSSVVTGTSTLTIYAQNASGTYLSRTNTSATIPATWTTSDAFNLSATYEAA